MGEITVNEAITKILADLDEIKSKIAAPAARTPAQTEGLFRFVRPAVRNIGQWPENVDMTEANAEEAFQRALHGVNWRGGHLAEVAYNEAWEEIEALKAGDWKLIAEYGPNGANLNPEFVGYALLVGLISPVKHDPETFGGAVSRRKSFAGATIQSFMDDQIRVKQGNGTVGIG